MSRVYDFDVVGSFLRPEYLLKAREEFTAGKISFEDLTKIEDEAIVDLVAKQKAAGLHFITDGEFRRATWHLDFMWGFEGVGHQATKTGIPFHGEDAMIDDTYLTGRLALKDHPFIDHFNFVKALEKGEAVAKQTIPAPAQFLEQFILPFAWEKTLEFYKDIDELIHDIVRVYNEFIAKLYEAGCRYLQLDDCTWGLCADKRAALIFGTDVEGLNKIMEQFLLVNNLVIEAKPKDLHIYTHVCRGNYNSTWACEGAYDVVADVLIAREKVERFYLEFDDERSGGFEPLAKLPADKEVVLGLVTSKFAALEDKELIKSRIKEATKYVPLERLLLSPQCGFASCDVGNKLTEEEQWNKIRHIKEIAEEVWG